MDPQISRYQKWYPYLYLQQSVSVICINLPNLCYCLSTMGPVQTPLPPGCKIGTKWSRECKMARLKSPAVFTSLPTASHHLSLVPHFCYGAFSLQDANRAEIKKCDMAEQESSVVLFTADHLHPHPMASCHSLQCRAFVHGTSGFHDVK